VSDARWAAFERDKAELARIREVMEGYVLSPLLWREHGFTINNDGIKRSAFEMLRGPLIDVHHMGRVVPGLQDAPRWALTRVGVDGKYAPMMYRQQADVLAFLSDEQRLLPPDLDYSAIRGISEEIKERLKRVRPSSLGAAKRMEGMTPSSYLYLARHTQRKSAQGSLEEGSDLDVATMPAALRA